MSAQSVTTNSHSLFFTGNKSNGFDTDETQLFIQKRNGAGYYFTYTSHTTNYLKHPGALLTYRDSLLLIANQGFIS
jgi:hypothetical protein